MTALAIAVVGVLAALAALAIADCIRDVSNAVDALAHETRMAREETAAHRRVIRAELDAIQAARATRGAEGGP
jgi:Tfp pilus assembly protein FimT